MEINKIKGFIELTEHKTTYGVSNDIKYIINVKQIISVETIPKSIKPCVFVDKKYDEPLQIYPNETYDEIVNLMKEATE